MSPYPHSIEQTMRTFYPSLRENDRRRYAAVEAAKLGHGGIESISAVLGIDPKAIRQGQRDLEDLPDRPTSRVRTPGGGRKRLLDQDPQIAEDFQKVLIEHTAGSPTQESLIWTNLTRTEIVDLMQECGSYVSVHIVDQLFDRYDYHERKALRMENLSSHPDRNDQFEVISRHKRVHLDSADLILSIDLKSRRGNAVFDALRRGLRHRPRDAERPGRHSHAGRGNEGDNHHGLGGRSMGSTQGPGIRSRCGNSSPSTGRLGQFSQRSRIVA